MKPPFALYTRRGFLSLGAAAAVSGALRWLFPGHPSDPADQANDFPVANPSLASGPPDMTLWRLSIEGAVANPLSLSYSELVSLRRERHRYALTCVSGWSTTQDWEGVPISTLLEMARPLAPEASISLTAADDLSRTFSHPKCRLPGAMVVTHVGGAPLSYDHGFPARAMFPGVDGIDDVKWLRTIRVLDA